ncbi:hypothetical protein DP939_25205 [Spongiactinospora rosea]|uniref:Uncharacterized protein n=1 Tax=Spongiactinospora rosea TaxID=2248750 RepID=A0A366LTJ5_9ACTN|nr:hypothetical protein DP939_25205 [Spongiactinospora rosea]
MRRASTRWRVLRVLRVLAGLVVVEVALGGLVWFLIYPPGPDDPTLSSLDQLFGVLGGGSGLAALWVAIITLRRAPPPSGAGPAPAAQGSAEPERPEPGWPLEQVRDPFHFGLEVHHAIDSPLPDAPPLPVYVPRAHDRALGEVVARAAAGASGIAVLVGGSSTGKTRACWEALAPLRGRELPWRVWHPIDPTRPEAALADLHGIAPYTVVWLNEAQFYLRPDTVGEQVAAGLRELLRDERRGPVLVLATLWPGEWDALTARPAAGPDLHAQARELLDGHDIAVPEAFTGDDLTELAERAATDPRLNQAAGHAVDGRITQYLAGVPVLLDRYAHAPPPTRAVIDAAMDARRLGAGPHLPLAWLAQAAPGYLTDAEWDQTGQGEAWLQRALDYVATPCNGIPGILTCVKPRTSRDLRTDLGGGGAPRAKSGPLYRLADYLDQHGRRYRVGQIPPLEFWDAADAHAHPADLTTLGDAAWARGLYLAASRLFKHATAHGDSVAAVALVEHLRPLHPGDYRPAAWAAAHVALDNPDAVAHLLGRLREAGAEDQVTTLLDRNPAAHATLDNPYMVAHLLEELREAGAEDQVTTLAKRAAAHATLDNPGAVAHLLGRLREAGAEDQVTTLLDRNPAAHATLDNPDAVAHLLGRLREAGAEDQVTTLLDRNPAAHAILNDPYMMAYLISRLREAGAEDQVTTLAKRAATHVALHDPDAVAHLLGRLREAGAEDQVTTLAKRAAAHAPLHDSDGVAYLISRLREAGAEDQFTTLAKRAAAHAPLDNPGAVARLLDGVRMAGAEDQVTTLLNRNPAAHATLDNPYMVAHLLEELREAGAEDQFTTLAKRAATHVALHDPGAVAHLLGRLREAGAEDQFTTLAKRAATHVALDNPFPVAHLLSRLRESGAEDQVTTLLDRNPAAHVALDNPYMVARLLEELREVGAEDQVTVLARRAAAHAPLDNPGAVARLLEGLREARAEDQVTTLAKRAAAHATPDNPSAVARLLDEVRMAGAEDQVALAERLPAAGLFAEFLDIGDHRKRFRFGREPDKSAAPAWGWEDLERPGTRP